MFESGGAGVNLWGERVSVDGFSPKVLCCWSASDKVGKGVGEVGDNVLEDEVEDSTCVSREGSSCVIILSLRCWTNEQKVGGESTEV